VTPKDRWDEELAELTDLCRRIDLYIADHDNYDLKMEAIIHEEFRTFALGLEWQVRLSAE